MTPIALNVLGVGLAEDRADRGGDHMGVAHRHPGQFVAPEMHSGAQGVSSAGRRSPGTVAFTAVRIYLDLAAGGSTLPGRRSPQLR
jgi:hypothetical protein